MIQLFVNSVPLDMKPSQQATLRKGAGLLDFEALEPTISTPISLPDTERNRKAFGHINIPASAAGFTRLPASIEHRGALIAEGEFILQSAREQAGFEGYFRADAGAVAANKDRLIGEILASHTFSWDSSVKADPQYRSPDSDISFPEMVWRQYAYDGNSEEPIFVNGSNNSDPYAPAFKVRHLLRILFEELGYYVKMEADSYLHRQLVLYARNTYSATKRNGCRELLPEMTLSAFIRSCRCIGFAIGINSQFLEVEIKSLNEVFGAPAGNWTEQAEPRPEIEPAYGEGSSKLEYAVSPRQQATIPPVDYATQLGTSSEEGDTALVRSEGRLYQMTRFGDEDVFYLDWAQGEPATEPAVLEREGFSGKSDFIPLPASKTFYFTAKEARIRERDGNIVLGGLPRSFRQDYSIRIINPAELGQTWHTEVLPRTSTPEGRVVLPIAYQQDYDSVEIEYRLSSNKLKPDRPQELEDKPLIGLFHGEQDSLDGPYSYAGPSSLAPRQSNPALDSAELRPESLMENELSALKQIVENGKQATFMARPKPSQLSRFSSLQPIEVDGVKYVIKALELRMGRDIWGEAEGWIG